MTEVKSLWERILDKAERQGLSFLILLALVVYFNNKIDNMEKKNDFMETKIDACNQENKEVMRTYLNEMKELLIRNTEALQDLKQSRK